ncbi:hypothetical protein PZA11_003625 [Diplocarpon coronariae]|uniref:Uncharacterized protein n=1 Tax=Diplocarpon coronariae TaxID=2795749 RepID=A0A218ZFS7_9HELO|nr:hypothetical protein JHW43_006211 [Diplocarpon mali]OWP06838.1 hypothetical protein B2J93_3834 [Marssonina coronariae]
MHRSTGSTAGGLFKGGSIFGGSKTPTTATRPSTSGGQTSTSESAYGSLASTFNRKSSISASNSKTHRGRNSSSAGITFSPERRARSNAAQQREALNIEENPLPTNLNLAAQREAEGTRSTNSFEKIVASAGGADPAAPGTEAAPYVNMMLARPGTGYQPSTTTALPPQSTPTLETITYQHIQETSSKRISTLDYLRKAHEGRVYWFNTVLFNKPDLQRMPYFDSRKVARRAINYLLLGLSIPTILDLNSSTALEFLKTLNALLAEFESFQQVHPPDGSMSISRGRFPQMFKRATGTSGKGRRQSSAAEIGLPLGNDSFESSTSSGGTNSSFPMGESDLLPGEDYTHLLTPSLPFDPDFYQTFATLCDVLIDCYTRLMSLVASPRECNPVVAEMFMKADSRVRKIIVQGVVKEFEDGSRGGVRSEVASIGKVVLGGLM